MRVLLVWVVAVVVHAGQTLGKKEENKKRLNPQDFFPINSSPLVSIVELCPWLHIFCSCRKRGGGGSLTCMQRLVCAWIFPDNSSLVCARVYLALPKALINTVQFRQDGGRGEGKEKEVAFISCCSGDWLQGLS